MFKKKRKKRGGRHSWCTWGTLLLYLRGVLQPSRVFFFYLKKKRKRKKKVTWVIRKWVGWLHSTSLKLELNAKKTEETSDAFEMDRTGSILYLRSYLLVLFSSLERMLVLVMNAHGARWRPGILVLTNLVVFKKVSNKCRMMCFLECR